RYKARCTGWIDTGPPWYISIPIGMNALNAFFCEVTYEYDPTPQIITPEPKNYSKPMEGYYPAIYGFENDDNGAYGTSVSILDEWTGNMGSFLRMYVRDGPYEGHNKVLEIFDSQSGGKTTGVHNFDNPQSAGTIEFWLMMKGAGEVGSTNRYHQIHFRKLDNTIAFRAQLKMLEGGWESGDRADIAYYDGNNWVEFADGEDLTWYRHRIDFDCTSGTKGQFSWYIYHADGSLLASIIDIDFENSMGTLDEIYFTSIQSHYRGSTYWDAFGFDWENNYNIGDNFEEGILIDIEPEDYTSLSYSLDSQPYVSMLGDTVIPMPDYGEHTLQVDGDGYLSELRTFTISPIIITSPLSIGYKKAPTSYPGTFSFTDDANYDDPGEFLRENFVASVGFDEDEVGDEPDEWKRSIYSSTVGFEIDENNENPAYFIVNEGSNCDVSVKESYEDVGGNLHTKVVQLQDESTSSNAKIYQNIGERESGSVEFWFATDELYGGTTYFIIKDSNSGESQIKLKADTYKLWYWDDSQNYWEAGIIGYPGNLYLYENLWYHLRITFECSNNGFEGLGPDTYNVYFDGDPNPFIHDIPFKGGGVDILDTLELHTSDDFAYYSSWFDAFGYSWDPYYEIGDNLNGIHKWEINNGGGCSTKVIDNIGGHRKVLELSDDSSSNMFDIYHSFSPQDYGTVEFFVRTTNVYRRIEFQLRDDTANLLHYRIDDCYHRLYGKYVQVLTECLADEWYHIRFDFETTDGGYMGLAEGWCRIYINNQDLGQYEVQNSVSPNKLRILSSYVVQSGFDCYVDAIGYSWDPSYTIGDNYQDQSQWAIQDGDDDQGNSCDLRIKGELGDHLKIVEMYHPTDAQSNEDMSMTDWISRSSGTVEFWVRTSDSDEVFKMRINDETEWHSVDFRIDDGKFKFKGGGQIYPLIDCENNHWYHIKIQFDCGLEGDGTNDWHLWIDGIMQEKEQGEGYNLPFEGDPQLMDSVYFFSHKEFNPVEVKRVFIDAIGYSWDPFYEIGDNRDPEILLSFTGQEELVSSSITYSLDGEPKEPIADFLQKPSAGEHTIQIFGILSNGDHVESEIRSFTVYNGPKLLCLHGYGNSYSIWNNHLVQRDDFADNYGLDNIIAFSYYGNKPNCPNEFIDVDFDTPIETIAEKLRDFLIRLDSEDPIEYLDIICFSMGGIVARYMIKHFYGDLKSAGISIAHVATLGSPHYYAHWAKFVAFRDVQTFQLSELSPFLPLLNGLDDTPHSLSDSGKYNDIKYSVYRGAWWVYLWRSDGMVLVPAAKLYSNDVTVYGDSIIPYPPYPFIWEQVYLTNHDGLYQSSSVLKDVFKEFWNN
ncbi:MAG: esterase/lipase family protein, partial [Candidatus Hermodarchaeota archaeon]